MGHRRNELPFFFPDLKYLHHERNGVVLLKPFGYGLFKNGGRERPERFPALDLGIEDCLHVGAAGIAHDRPVAERARAPFHAPLKPTDDLAVGNRSGGAVAKFRLVRNFFDYRIRLATICVRCSESTLAMSAGPNSGPQ